jgi:hypothetical protein
VPRTAKELKVRLDPSFLLRAPALLLLAALAACEGAPFGADTGAPPVALAFQASVASAPEVDLIVIEVSGPGIAVPIFGNFPVVNGRAEGTLRVPAGSGRVFSARGFDGQGAVTHEGSVTRDVRPNGPPVQIPLPPRGVGVPIEVTLGGYAVSLTPGTALLEVGGALQFAAQVTDTDGNVLESPTLTWGSANPAFARVDGEGLATGFHPGTTRIVVSFQGIAAEAQLTVVAAVDPPSVTITAPADAASFEVGEAVTFSGSATEASGAPLTGAALVWTSDRDGVLGTGEVVVRTDLSIGAHTVTLTATDADGREGTASVAVEVTEPSEPPVLTTIAVTPELATISGPGTERFTATAFDQFGRQMPDVEFTWSSSNLCVASIDPAGLATTAFAPGDAVIRASAGGVSGMGTLRTSHPPSPAPASLTGDWLVCQRSDGAFRLTLHLVHETGSELVTGSVRMADGRTATLNNGSWSSDVFSGSWNLDVLGGLRTFLITEARAQGTNRLRGRYADRDLLATYDVEIVRVVP